MVPVAHITEPMAVAAEVVPTAITESQEVALLFRPTVVFTVVAVAAPKLTTKTDQEQAEQCASSGAQVVLSHQPAQVTYDRTSNQDRQWRTL